MAKGGVNVEALSKSLIEDARRGIFKQIYLLMGDEPYYPEMVCQAILDNCLKDWDKDFNQTVCYGSEVDAESVISAARRFPMMAERQLVVVKEAQLMKDLDTLSLYCSNPLDSTVFVILMHGASADKRKALYKSVQKTGVVLESPALKDYEIVNWILYYYKSRSLELDPAGAQLLAECAGTDLGKIVVETDKLLKNLPEGTSRITVGDIEKNVGVSRQFSIFELNKALSFRDAAKAVRTATYVGSAAKFAMPAAVSALYSHFNRILKYEAARANGPVSQEDKIRILGVPPFFFKEYDTAAQNYPMQKCISIISMLEEYDFKGKGGDVSSDTDAGQLLLELTTKILNI